VRVTDFGDRWNSFTPSSSSSLAIEAEGAGCDTAALIALKHPLILADRE
jgi:hypothetical protein